MFQEVYFCNVQREHDKVTKWIRENWSPDKIGWENYEWAMVLARFLNWPDTLSFLLIHDGYVYDDPVGLENLLKAIAVEKGKVWGNAYVITSHGIPMPKATYLCERVLPKAYNALGAGRWRDYYGSQPPTLAQHHERLMGLEGLGSFLAAQVIADLKNTKGHPLEKATDWWEWAAPGPGSLRGLNWYFDKSVAPSSFQQAIQHIQGNLKAMGVELNAQDVQNCLCEFDKYMRVLTGTGRSKRKYNGQ